MKRLLPILLFAGAAVASGASAQEVTPPTVDQHVDASVPDGALAPGEVRRVEMIVLIDAGGHVTDVKVPAPGVPAIDDAAIAAMKQWTFHPATRGGVAVSARTRLAIEFVGAPASQPTSAPATEPTTEAATEPATEPVATTQPATEPATAPVAETEPTTEPTIPTLNATIRGRARPPSTGASTYVQEVGQLKDVPHAQGAAGLLQLAPGFLLSNEGGAGHADKIFLRGFDAGDGQDLEITADGIPVNEAGNLHGNGYADLHFIIPELVQTLRIVEGPFDPRQGNFAVAGSAEYELGLPERGLVGKFETGSFNTQRLALLWGPPGHGDHTFGGVEVFNTDGFGENRDAHRATAMGQYEGRLGDDGTFRLSSGVYTTAYHSAGIVRQDDYEAGRIGFYDTYDTHQGGDATRFYLNADLELKKDDFTQHHQIFALFSTMRIRENFTGFLLDTQEPTQLPHDQRGDLLDLFNQGVTVGVRGFARKTFHLLGHPQELELGYFGRVDHVISTQYRIANASQTPYLVDADLDSLLGDVGLYAAANLKLHRLVSLRGGVREELLTYDKNDLCAQQAIAHPGQVSPEIDQSCYDEIDFGVHREPAQHATATGSVTMPRASLLLGPIASLTLSLSAGLGIRSIDPIYVTQDERTPFASIAAYEGGLTFARRLGEVETNAHLVFFRTHVDHDTVFSENVGRAIIGGGTTRNGVSLSGRATGKFFDVAASVTDVESKYDDTGLLVAYVPDLVGRLDGAVFHPLWKGIVGTLSTGITYIGPRALPYGQRSDRIFTIDASARATWKNFTLGLSAQNLLDTRYRLDEFNFASDFHTVVGRPPTLVPAREFTAGPPLTLLLTLEVRL